MNTAKGEILASRLGVSLYPKRAICQNSSAKEQFIGGKFVVDYLMPISYLGEAAASVRAGLPLTTLTRIASGPEND